MKIVEIDDCQYELKKGDILVRCPDCKELNHFSKPSPICLQECFECGKDFEDFPKPIEIVDEYS